MLSGILPQGSTQRKLVKKVLYKLGFKRFADRDFYMVWAEQNHLTIPLRPDVELTYRPLISIILPAYNTPARYILPLLDSIIGQTYDNWELVFVNASTKHYDKAYIESCAKSDSRITLIDFPNKGISVNTNEGVKAAKGEYVSFVDHDDLLDHSALMEVAKAINENPKAGILYTDEDKISDNGERYFDPHLKPDWSPDLMANANYINHFTTVKKSLAVKAGLLNPDRDGAQDFDFLWRVIDTGAQIVHIPKILYHWREAQNSTAADFSSKPKITQSGRKSLEEHFDRIRQKAEVEIIPNRPGFYKVVYERKKDISLIIPPIANPRLLSLYVELLLRQTKFDGLHVIIGEQLSIAEEHLKTIEVTKIKETDYRKFLDEALKISKPNLVIINQPVLLPPNPDWLKEMSGLLGVERIASATPLIVNNEREVEDAGLAGDPMAPMFTGYKFGDRTYMESTELVRDVDALSGWCIFVRQDELGKFLGDYKGLAGSVFSEFTRQQSALGRYNVVWTHQLMNNASFRLASPDHNSKFLNPSIFTKKDDMRVYSTEEQVIEYLLYVKKEQFHEQI